MKSFGRLLRKMRGSTPLEVLAERTRLDPGYLAQVEGRRVVPDEVVVRHVLSRGFDLTPEEVTRVVLGLQLYDLGLREADLRQLVIDCITRSIPSQAREALRRTYQGYTESS